MRKRYESKGREYKLSNQNNLNYLCTRIENDMPLEKRPNETEIKDIPSDL